MNPLVSIAIATYNGEQFLEEQLNSIYSQTYRNIEVVVSDDYSVDSTISILTKYQESHNLKFSVNEDRLGVTKNFEKAIVGCTGEYILLSDQDDVWFPEKIERLLSNIGDASLIYSDGIVFKNQDGFKEERISSLKWIAPFGIDSNDSNFFKYAILNSFILGCSVMFTRELVKEALPLYESSYNHDWWLILCAQNQSGVKYLDEVLFKYRLHENNFSMSREKKNKSIYKQLVLFFWFESRRDRKQRKHIIANIVSRFGNKIDKEFMADMLSYTQSRKEILNFKDLKVELKNRKFLYPSFSNFRRYCAVVASLIK